MHFEIDGGLYPDCPPPQELTALPERIDYLARLCAAWDFGLLPDVAVVKALRASEWTEAVDKTRLLTSHSYSLLRRWHGLEQLPYLGDVPAFIRNDPCWDRV